MVHEHGGQVYLDGANLNAQVCKYHLLVILHAGLPAGNNDYSSSSNPDGLNGFHPYRLIYYKNYLII